MITIGSLKSERAERRRLRHEQFCAARTIQNIWRCNMAGYVVETARRKKASISVQRIWRGTKTRQQLYQTQKVQATLIVQCAVRRLLAIKQVAAKRDVLVLNIQQKRSAIKLQARVRGYKVRKACKQRKTVTTFVTSMCDSVFEQCGIKGMSSIIRKPNSNQKECGQVDEMSSPMQFTFSEPSTVDINTTNPMPTNMPKLSLSALPKNGQTYHEEFLSHSNEFSKSWREQLDQEEERFGPTDNGVDTKEECHTSRTDGGTVVETIRNLRNLRKTKTNQNRPSSSPVKRTTGPVSTKPKTRRIYKYTPKLFVPKERDEIKEIRKLALERVAVLEKKRMKKVRDRAAKTLKSRKKQEQEKIDYEIEEKERELTEKKEREYRFKEGMAELRESLKQSVLREKSKQILIKKQKDIENVQRIKNEKLANQLYLQKEQKRKEWIKKQSERRAIRQILEEKLSNEAREREMEDKRRREDIRMKKEFIAREKRQDAAAKKDIQLKQLLHFEKEERKLKSELRTAELKKKASVAMKKVQERLKQKRKEDAAMVKRLKKERLAKEKEMRRIKMTAKQRRHSSMAQNPNTIPTLKTLHPGKKSKRSKKRYRNGRSSFSSRKVDFEELSLLSARSSPSRLSRNGHHRTRLVSELSAGEESVLIRAMREASRNPRSAPTSPRDDDDDDVNGGGGKETNRMPYPRRDRFHNDNCNDRGRHTFQDDTNGADALLELDQMNDSFDHEEEDVGVVEVLPVRKNGESVDDYIARATRMLEKQAFDEL